MVQIVKELGGVCDDNRLEYSESNNFTTNNDFRKVGLFRQPKFPIFLHPFVVDHSQLSFFHHGTEQPIR